MYSQKYCGFNSFVLTFYFCSHGTCNAVVLWADYDFDDKHIISTGPREATVINKKIEWDYYSRQGVHLLKRPIKMSKEESELITNCSIKVEASFEPFKSEDFTFCFTIENT